MFVFRRGGFLFYDYGHCITAFGLSPYGRLDCAGMRGIYEDVGVSRSVTPLTVALWLIISCKALLFPHDFCSASLSHCHCVRSLSPPGSRFVVL